MLNFLTGMFLQFLTDAEIYCIEVFGFVHVDKDFEVVGRLFFGHYFYVKFVIFYVVLMKICVFLSRVWFGAIFVLFIIVFVWFLGSFAELIFIFIVPFLGSVCL